MQTIRTPADSHPLALEVDKVPAFVARHVQRAPTRETVPLAAAPGRVLAADVERVRGSAAD